MGYGLLSSVLADLQYSELDVLVGLSFIFALEDHDFVVLRADSQLPCHLQHETDQFIRLLQQVCRNFVSDNATACVNLPDGRRVDGAGEDGGLGALSGEELGEVSALGYNYHQGDFVVQCQFHRLRREDLGNGGIGSMFSGVLLRVGSRLLVVVDALGFYNSFGGLDGGCSGVAPDGRFMCEDENVRAFERRR